MGGTQSLYVSHEETASPALGVSVFPHRVQEAAMSRPSSDLVQEGEPKRSGAFPGCAEKSHLTYQCLNRGNHLPS